MMDKGQHDARVWHLLYHSLPTPDPDPVPHLTRHVSQIPPDWSTVPTVSNHPLPGFTGGITVRMVVILALRWPTVAKGGVAIENTLWLCCICVVKIQHHFRKPAQTRSEKLPPPRHRTSRLRHAHDTDAFKRSPSLIQVDTGPESCYAK